MIRVYFAAKLNSAKLIRDLEAEWTEIQFTARWPSLVGLVEDTPENAKEFWAEDFEDIVNSDALVVLPAPMGYLRGALVEAGFALAHGRPVIVVGEDPAFGTWQYARGVHRVPGLPEARMLLNVMGVK